MALLAGSCSSGLRALVCAYQPGCARPWPWPRPSPARPRPCVRVTTADDGQMLLPVYLLRSINVNVVRGGLLPPRLHPDDARALLPSVPSSEHWWRWRVAMQGEKVRMPDRDRARGTSTTRPPVSRPVRDPRGHAVQCRLRSSVHQRTPLVRKGLPSVRGAARPASYAHRGTGTRLGCARRGPAACACGPPGAPPYSLHGRARAARGARARNETGAVGIDGDGLRGPWDGFVPHGRGHGGGLILMESWVRIRGSERSGRGGEGGGGPVVARGGERRRNRVPGHTRRIRSVGLVTGHGWMVCARHVRCGFRGLA